jgi:FKBP-type peptidyl-prolyl cis-trans isomerase FkpA
MRSFRYLPALVILSLVCGACSAQTPSAPAAGAAPAAGSDEATTLYVMGLVLSQNVQPLHLSEAELQTLVSGLSDGALSRPHKSEIEPNMAKVSEWVQARQMATAKAEKEAGAAYIEKAVAEGAQKTASGMAIKMITEGSGTSPQPGDNVVANYTGTTIDGKVFDTTTGRDPGTFGVRSVIPCWTEALQMMKPGGKAKLYCPSNLAYGDRGRPPKIGPGATLLFEVELLEVKPAAAQPPVPAPSPTPTTPPKH